MIEAVVFDMDGVIVDSEPVWQQARVDLVGEYGGEWSESDGDATRGLASAVWAARISERLDGALTPRQVFAQILERMIASYQERLPVFPGAVEAIERVADRYTVAVASGSPNVLIDLVLEKSGLGAMSAAVGYGDEVPRGKPAPDVYLDVLGRLEVTPQAAVGVEDSKSGLESVHAAGMHSIALMTSGYDLPGEILRRTVFQIQRLEDLTVAMIGSISD